MRKPCVDISQLSKSYAKTPVLQQLDLQIYPGEVLAILGENGAGKTTLLKIILGLTPADQGEVLLFGQAVTALAHNLPLRGRIGVMMQQSSLPASLTVLEHLQLFSSYYPNPVPLPELIADCGLGALLSQKFGQLSGGQQQAVLFALAMIGRPELLFLDEPTTGLDVAARQAFWQQIRHAANKGLCVVLTTHYLEEADQLASRILVLQQGRFIADTTPAGLKMAHRGKQIVCRTQLTAELIASWPEVCQCEVIAPAMAELEVPPPQLPTAALVRQICLHSTSAEQTLRRLLAADAEVADLTVSSVSLEQAFLTLTQTKEHAA